VPLDLDLQELRRAVTAAPTDAQARVALALGLIRCGARTDAATELYRARALGGDAEVCRASLKGLGARPSPWTHFSGDSEPTRTSPVTGPRRGEIVATSGEITDRPEAGEAFRLVLDEDGTILLVTDDAIHALDGRTLTPRASVPLAYAHLLGLCVAGDGRVLVCDRAAGKVGLLNVGAMAIGFLDLEVRVALVAASRSERIVLAAVGAGEDAPVRVASLAPTLDRLETRFECPALFRGSLPLHDSRVALFTRRRVRVLGLSGQEERGANLDGEGACCAFAPDGTLIVGELTARGPHRAALDVSALDPLGRIAWTTKIAGVSIPFELGAPSLESVLVRTGDELVRVEPRKVAWRRFAPRVGQGWLGGALLGGELVVDATGTAYACFLADENVPVLSAVCPDESLLFELRGIESVFAIDAWGRLLARRGREIVAIE
jgi:hypothetical protein